MNSADTIQIVKDTLTLVGGMAVMAASTYLVFVIITVL